MVRMTPERLAQTRVITTGGVLRNEVDLRTYPHRHLAVLAQPGISGTGVTELLTVVEYLDHYLGWELVNVTSVSNTRGLYAFLRRR